ncbi:protein-disulfide reductase DsbD family protein [Photobacterium sanguinicancri]|uniref:protein-disulfide reductase DsbD family protein n=1 Tax=Photobacterium sanguinicancri TaxID=875932 RepID=UPI002691B1BC
MKKAITSQNTLLTMFAALLFSLFAFNAQAKDYTTGWLTNPMHPPVQVRFMLTGQTDEAAKTVEGLLEVDLEGDWKTYWRSPGEGGVAPKIDWEMSNNISDLEWHWPMPKRYEFLGVETLGYKHKVVFPMTVTVDDFSKPVFLSGKLTMSSCTSICVLTDYEVVMDFIPNQLTPSTDAMHLYNQGMSNVPADSANVSIDQTSWNNDKQELSVLISNTQAWSKPDVFVDSSDIALENVSFSSPSITKDNQQLIATFKVSSWFGKPDLTNKTLNVTVTDADMAVEEQAVAATLPITTQVGSSIWQTIAFALIGGLILNIMPCVLPVLGMKLSSIIATDGMERRQIRTQFIASAAGILVSFWLLAGFLTALKVSGQALGWGIQFQSPYFIGAMIIITGAFAANMLGLFEISLSSNTNTWLATRGDNSHLGHFVQGMFATLLATPCSAPFLGTAVAYALGADIVTLFAIFTALAIGMAAPWLLIALFPQLASKLPKPGNWMNGVKTLFGLMMLATSLWLLSLMTSFVSTGTVVGFAVTSLILLLWRLGQVKGRKSVVITLAVILLGGASSLFIGSLTADKWSTPLPADHVWQPLKSEEISQAVAQGKTVFVDVTADWCITCKANKIGVMLQNPVYDKLDQDNIVLMRGDWTTPSDYVTGFLQSYGRFGVPFNIVYGPNAPEGIALPVILTSADVMGAITEAEGKSTSNNKG